MASAFSHALVALAMGKAFESKILSRRELALGACCSVLPDLDVIGLYVGIQYGDLWGHRGLTHSVAFAALVAGSLVGVWYRGRPAVAMAGLFLSLHRVTWSARCPDQWRVRRGVFFSVRYGEIFLPCATGPGVSNRRQRIFQRVRCSDPSQRSDMDLAAVLRGACGASCRPVALVGQVSGISFIAIVRSRSSFHSCRVPPTSCPARQENEALMAYGQSISRRNRTFFAPAISHQL